MMPRSRVVPLLAALALLVCTATVHTAAFAMPATPSQPAGRLTAAISASFQAANRALTYESCSDWNCGYTESFSSGPLSGKTLYGEDHYYQWALPDSTDCSGFDGDDCWETSSQTFTQSPFGQYTATVTTESDLEEQCSDPNTYGWAGDIADPASVSNTTDYTVTAGWKKGQFRGGNGQHDQCFSGHEYGLDLIHWIYVNGGQYGWNTGVELVG